MSKNDIHVSIYLSAAAMLWYPARSSLLLTSSAVPLFNAAVFSKIRAVFPEIIEVFPNISFTYK